MVKLGVELPDDNYSSTGKTYAMYCTRWLDQFMKLFKPFIESVLSWMPSVKILIFPAHMTLNECTSNV